MLITSGNWSENLRIGNTTLLVKKKTSTVFLPTRPKHEEIISNKEKRLFLIRRREVGFQTISV